MMQDMSTLSSMQTLVMFSGIVSTASSPWSTRTYATALVCFFYLCGYAISTKQPCVYLQKYTCFLPACSVFSVFLFHGRCVLSVCVYTHTAIPVCLTVCVFSVFILAQCGVVFLCSVENMEEAE